MQSNRVIIADDDAFVCESISKLLKQFNLETEKIKDGEECVKAFKSNPNLRFILMDVNMPNLDGFEATKEIRKFESSKGLPQIKIYGLSADDSDANKNQCKSSGMTDLIIKPLNKAKLQAIL